MKRSLIAILSLIFTVNGICQPVTTNPYLGAPKTLTYVKGWLRVDSGYIVSDVSIVDASHIQVCATGVTTKCDTFTTAVYASTFYVVDNRTLLVCDTIGNCDTLSVPSLTFNSGFYFPNQGSFEN